jgi:hypothetical protein
MEGTSQPKSKSAALARGSRGLPCNQGMLLYVHLGLQVVRSRSCMHKGMGQGGAGRLIAPPPPPPPPTMETLCLDDISVLDEVQTGTSYQVQRVASCTHCTKEAVFSTLKPFPRRDPIFLA